MANHKRKHKHWQKLCMCKYYKQAGNGRNRRPARDLRKVDVSQWQTTSVVMR